MGLAICSILLFMFGLVFQVVLPKAVTVMIFSICLYLLHKAWVEDEQKEEREKEQLGMGNKKTSQKGDSNWFM